jgi:cobalamin biosynthesis protein CobD/CbiB
MKNPGLEDLNENDNNKEFWKLLKIRFDYGWNFFDLHAKQRTTMFNFFILFSGVLANAYVLLIRNDYIFLSTFVSVLGVIISLLFIFLDRRNEELVHVAEDVLLSLEKDILFKDYNRIIDWPKQRTWLGKMESHKAERQLGIILREEADKNDHKESKYAHGTWLPLIQLIIAMFFLLCLLYSLCRISIIIAIFFSLCCIYLIYLNYESLKR